jgi:hypothetical protein
MAGMAAAIGKVFISYSRSDAQVADRIAGALEQAGVNVWIDHRRVDPGASFVEAINAALDDASYVLLLLSPAALASPWVTREWASSLAARNTTIVPVRIAAVDPPRLLLDKLYVDLVDDFDAGLQRLIQFFVREAEPPVRPVKGKPVGLLAGASRYEIRRVAFGCLDEVTFRSYLFDLEIDPGSVRGESLQEKILELLHRVHAEGMIKELLRSMERDRAACLRTQLERARADQHRADDLEL